MKLLPCATAVAVVTATAALAAFSSSGPSHPHAWCAPLLAQLRGHDNQAAYAAGLTRLQGSGAPVGKLAADLAVYENDKATADVPGTASFAALAAEPAAIAKVSADLQSLNAECGQPADAYKSDAI